MTQSAYNPSPSKPDDDDTPSSGYSPTSRMDAAWAAGPAVAEAPAPSPSVTTRARFGRPAKTGGVSEARRANLVVARFEPWSVMKFSFMISLVAWVVLFVAVALMYFALSGLGVFTSIEHTFNSVTSGQGTSGTNVSQWLSASRVLGYTMLVGAVNVVLITALSTVGAMIYNLVTHLGGGIEVTLREPE